jgi:hypothetical protein
MQILYPKKQCKLILFITLAVAISGQCHSEKESAATKRFRTQWQSTEDRDNEFYTLFLYSHAVGLGFQENVSRRDPTTVLKVGDTYYVWYTRSWGDRPIDRATATEACYDEANPRIRRTSWDYACIGYATSKDGFTWKEQGKAVCPGPAGSFDSRSVFTPDVMYANGKYYLYYQACATKDERPTVIGMSWADSPDGPWHRHDKPVLLPTEGANQICHDPNLIYRDGKFWLYYKGGVAAGPDIPSPCWGVAFADQPEGPFVNSELNPITTGGHEVLAWPYKEGVALLVTRNGVEKNTVQYAPDGLNFEVKAHVTYPPNAAGGYIPDKYTDTTDGQGFTWGISHVMPGEGHPEAYLVRFDCDLSQSVEWPENRKGIQMMKDYWTPNPGVLLMHQGNRLEVKDRLRPEDRHQ